MDQATLIILMIEGVIFTGFAIALVYLIIKRIRSKREEDFEKRDN